MSRYILIRRLRGPAFLLLIGIVALLHQTGAVYHMWRLFWPLALMSTICGGNMRASAGILFISSASKANACPRSVSPSACRSTHLKSESKVGSAICQVAPLEKRITRT